MDAEIALQSFLVDQRGSLHSAHDLAEGGLGVALAEAALTNGIGFTVEGTPDHADLFSESPSRAIVTCGSDVAAGLLESATARGIKARVIGITGGQSLNFGSFSVDLEEANGVYERSLPDLLSKRVS
jgi:phosphoribosylformylglycinamidine synthase